MSARSACPCLNICTASVGSTLGKADHYNLHPITEYFDPKHVTVLNGSPKGTIHHGSHDDPKVKKNRAKDVIKVKRRVTETIIAFDTARSTLPVPLEELLGKTSICAPVLPKKEKVPDVHKK